MRVAGLQLDIAWEDPAENFRRAEALVVRAVADGARLLVLPEMFNTGFSMEAARVSAHAESTRSFLAACGRRHDVWLMGGYADPGPRRVRNACSLFSPAGAEVLRYHKIHPFTLAREHESYDGGERLLTADVEGVRVTPLICYDLRFPEPFRAAAAATDLFIVIANWPEPRAHAWRSLLIARAIENQAWVLGVNRVGAGDGLTYRGDSALHDPLGDVVIRSSGQSGVVAGAVDTGAVARLRERFSFLADRRPDVYALLAEPDQPRA